MTTTLVTGGAGFIGSHFVDRLLRQTDDQVVVLDHFNDYYAPERKRANVAGFKPRDRVEIAELDFCDANAVERLFERRPIDRVVHLGGYAGVRNSVENPLVYQHANVFGTCVLLEAARRHPLDAGAHGLLVEFHPDPGAAKSDGPQALDPRELEALAEECLR